MSLLGEAIAAWSIVENSLVEAAVSLTGAEDRGLIEDRSA